MSRHHLVPSRTQGEKTVGRNKNEITWEGPIATLATELRTARKTAGDPTYRDMSKLANCSHTALSQADAGKKLPTWEVVRAHLNACGVTGEDDIAPWRERWHSTKRAVDLRKELQRSVPRPRRPERLNKQTALPPGDMPTLTIHAGQTPVPSLDKVNTMDDLVNALNDLLDSQGLNLTALSRRIDDAVSPTINGSPPWHSLTTETVRGVLTGKVRPTLHVMAQVVNACRGTNEELAAWTACFRRIQSLEQKAQAQLDHLLDQIKADIQDPAGVLPTRSALKAAEGPISPPQDHREAWRERWDWRSMRLAVVIALPAVMLVVYTLLAALH